MSSELVLAALEGQTQVLATGPGPEAFPQAVQVPEDWDAQQEYFATQGWSDGLPLVPPTPRRVEGMFAAAVLDPVFNIYGVQTTTHPCGPLVIVNGPVSTRLEINSRGNCFGPGWRANATIGRAVRLVLHNVGGGRPGERDRATMGQPGKFTACIAENEAESPWGPLHADRGLDPGRSAVTVIPAEAPHNINDHGSISADGVLSSVAGTMSTTGSNSLYWGGDTWVILSPEHAATVARDGLGKAEVRKFLHRQARVPAARFSSLQREHFHALGGQPAGYIDPDGQVALVASQEDIFVVVAGGAGKHSMWVPTFGLCRSVTRPVRD